MNKSPSRFKTNQKTTLPKITRNVPNFDDLAWGTMELLTRDMDPKITNPGLDEVIAMMFRDLRASSIQWGNVFANPSGMIRSPKADALFFKEARRLQKEWFRRLNSVFHSSSRVKREMIKAPEILRQLKYTGVLFVDNQHIYPNQWPDKKELPIKKERVPVGKRFGRLVVKEVLPKGMIRCQCDCGVESVKMRKHLNSGGTKSCGCLLKELHERQWNRKKGRGWMYSGVL